MCPDIDPTVRAIMSEKLDALFADFVTKARQILIQEAMASFSALAAGGGGQPDPLLKAKGKPGPKQKSPAAPKPPKKAKWAKRTPEELESLSATILKVLKQSPGLRSEQLGAKIVRPTSELALPLKALVSAGALKTKGVRRGMQYFPGKG